MAHLHGFILAAFDEDKVCHGFVERDVHANSNSWERIVGKLEDIKDLRKTTQMNNASFTYKILEIRELP